jgi:[protein-PII] uridylyltransferase
MCNNRAILETFLIYQTTLGIKGLSARTLRALYNAGDELRLPRRPDQSGHQHTEEPGLTHAFG